MPSTSTVRNKTSWKAEVSSSKKGFMATEGIHHEAVKCTTIYNMSNKTEIRKSEEKLPHKVLSLKSTDHVCKDMNRGYKTFIREAFKGADSWGIEIVFKNNDKGQGSKTKYYYKRIFKHEK